MSNSYITKVGTKFISDEVPLPVNSEGDRATYGYAATAVTPAATPTDVVTLYGSSTKLVKVKKVIFTGVATTAGTMNPTLIKRTSANTAGTATTPTAAKFDTSDTAATATLSQYSANPSAVGTGIAIAAQACNFGVAGASGTVIFDFAQNNDKPIFLNGTTEGLAINLLGAAVPSGGTFGYSIEWEEV